MSSFFLCLLVISTALFIYVHSLPPLPKPPPDLILSSDFSPWDGKSYSFNYKTASGNSRTERGSLEKTRTGDSLIKVVGEYSYPLLNGSLYKVSYAAGDRGFSSKRRIEHPYHRFGPLIRVDSKGDGIERLHNIHGPPVAAAHVKDDRREEPHQNYGPPTKRIDLMDKRNEYPYPPHRSPMIRFDDKSPNHRNAHDNRGPVSDNKHFNGNNVVLEDKFNPDFKQSEPGEDLRRQFDNNKMPKRKPGHTFRRPPLRRFRNRQRNRFTPKPLSVKCSAERQNGIPSDDCMAYRDFGAIINDTITPKFNLNNTSASEGSNIVTNEGNTLETTTVFDEDYGSTLDYNGTDYEYDELGNRVGLPPEVVGSLLG